MRKRIFNKKLKLFLLSKGITQTELAIRSGLSQGTVSGIITGTLVPHETQVAKISKALNCDRRKIF